MKRVTIYTDGACQGNPGRGGWAAILIRGTTGRERVGASPATTNNRMEMTAAIAGLRALKGACAVDLHTDSQYVQNGMRSWLADWKRKGWRTANKKPVKNQDLWQALDAEANRHTIDWHWVKGHSRQPENERCDRLAVQAIEDLRAELGEAALAQALRDFRREGGLF